MDLGNGFTLTSDYFYAHQNQFDRNFGIQFNSTNWQGATYVPVQSRDTGSTALGQYNTPHDPNAAAWAGSHIYTTQVYEKWPGDVESFSQVIRRRSPPHRTSIFSLISTMAVRSRGSVRGMRETASQHSLRPTSIFPTPMAACGPTPTAHLPCGTFVYPAQLGGNRVFNANGIPQNTVPITADLSGRNLTISMPSSLASAFADPNGWTMKTLESTDDYDRNTAITALRFDGHYDFNNDIHLKFGVRNSIRSADNDGFTLVTPVYGGMGASDPNGCLVRYVGCRCDPEWQSTTATWCTAGNAQGSFRAGPLSAQQMPNTPAPLANNWRQYNNLLGSGINFWAIDPQRHGQSRGVLEVALSQYHEAGGARNHLGRVHEGNCQAICRPISAASSAACRTAATWVYG